MASDSFTRANEAPLAAPWATCYGGGCNLTSNQVVAATLEDRGSFYSGSNGNESIVTVGALTSSTAYSGCLVRASSGAGLQVYTDGASGAGHTGFARWSGGTQTDLGAIAATFVNGDKLRLVASGASPNITLTAYKWVSGAWSQIGQLTNVTGQDSGSSGIAIYGTATADDWTDTSGPAASIALARMSFFAYPRQPHRARAQGVA